jgi:hypothetical protein
MQRQSGSRICGKRFCREEKRMLEVQKHYEIVFVLNKTSFDLKKYFAEQEI